MSAEQRGTGRVEGVYSGFMTDAFAVAGSGPARLNNGFVGHFESDFATFVKLPIVISSHGDPLDFVTGEVLRSALVTIRLTIPR
jgi:hypothetical protein